MSSGFARSEGEMYWDFELVCEAPVGVEQALAVRVKGSTYLREEGVLSVVFARKGASMAEAVGQAVLDLLSGEEGVKVVGVNLKPRRLI